MEMKEIIGNYEAPEVEVIEVEVEKGFATSDGGSLEGYKPGGSGSF